MVQGRRLFSWSPRGLSDFQPKFVPKVRGQEVRQLSGWNRLTGRRKSKKHSGQEVDFFFSFVPCKEGAALALHSGQVAGEVLTESGEGEGANKALLGFGVLKENEGYISPDATV